MNKYNKDIQSLPSWEGNDEYDDDDNDNGSFDVQSYEDIDDDDFIKKLEKEIEKNNINDNIDNASPDYIGVNSTNKKTSKNPLPSSSRFTTFNNTTSTNNTDTKSKAKYEEQILKRYMLKYLDSCFNKMKSLDILLKNIEELTAQKGELSEIDVTTFNSDLVRSFKTNNDSIYEKILSEKLIPSKVIKAINLLNRSHSDLQRTMQSILTTLCSCMKHQKSTYTRQFKKVRDIANDSIRNSILIERSKELDNISKLTIKYEEDKALACAKIQENLDNVKVLNETLQNEIDSVRQQLVKVQSSITVYASEHSKQSALELRKQKETFEEEKQKLLKIAEEEAERQKLEFANLLNAKVKSFERAIELQRDQEIEVRTLIQQQQLKQEDECFQLREQLIKVVAALNIEKERNSARVNEAREKGIKEVDELKTESLKEKALMRVELTKSILKVRDEEKHDKAALAQAIVLNDQKHIEDMQRLRLKIESDNKALIEKMEIDNIEEMGRVRYHHHQEIAKLNKRIERLSSLLSKAGVPVIDDHLVE